jgi:hypothetical protein
LFREAKLNVQEHQNVLQLRFARYCGRDPGRGTAVRPKDHRFSTSRRKLTKLCSWLRLNEIAVTSINLLGALATTAAPTNRAEEAAKAKARAAERFGR